jgi:hypothetical protein
VPHVVWHVCRQTEVVFSIIFVKKVIFFDKSVKQVVLYIKNSAVSTCFARFLVEVGLLGAEIFYSRKEDSWHRR